MHGRARPTSRAPPNGGNCIIRGATRRRHAGRMLLMVQNPHHYPGRHAPSLASRSLTGAGQPGGTPINARKASPMVRILSEALRRGRPSAGILPRRCLGTSRDQRAWSYIRNSDTMLERVAASPPGSDPRAGGPPFSYHAQARRPRAQCLGQNCDVRSVPSCNGGATGRAHSAWGVSSR